MHHQGFGDLFTNNSLCNYYNNLYDELIIFALDESRKIVIEEMYKHKQHIQQFLFDLYAIRPLFL